MALIREKGFTLLELMIVIAILGLMAAMAGPSISGYIDKRKIINAAEAVYSQLLFARSQAISRSAVVNVNFGYTDNADASTWLMGISTNSNCDVAQTVTPADVSDDCTLVVSDGDGNLDDGTGTIDPGDLVYYVTSGADFNGVKVDSDGSGSGGSPNSFSFNPTRGTAGNETIYLTYDKGDSQYEMRVIVAVIGRVRICTPVGDKQVPGYTSTTSSTGC